MSDLMINICILTRNRVASLQRLLNPIYWDAVHQINATSPYRVRTVILDQGSTDETERFCRSSAGITYIRAASNWGCAGGRQRIVDRLFGELKAGDCLVFLDDDLIPQRVNWLIDLMLPILMDEADIAGVEGKQVLPDGLTANADGNPDYVSGGWVAIAAEVFLAGVEFDPQFNPNYYEDVDLCYQARHKGFRIVSVGDVGLFHDASPGGAAKIAIFEHSRSAFMEKWNV